MKRMALKLSAGLALAVLAGCSSKPTLTNGGIPASSAGKVGVQSSNGKAQTGSVMMMNQSNMPPGIARKFKGGAGTPPN